MFYGYVPSLYWSSAQPSTNSSTSPSKSNPTTTCSSSPLLVKMLLYVHTGLHLLAIALAASSLHHISSDHTQAAELLIVGTSGALTGIMAMMGLWYKQRQFLLPLVVYLLASIVLDSIAVFYYYVASPNANRTYPKMSPISLYPNTDRMMPYLIVKLVLSIWLVKRLITVYRKNLTIRTGKSPLRKQSPPSCDKTKVEKGGDKSESPVLKGNKVGKYSKFENCEDV
eukprot:GFUD01051149.1.p1 GENE.GFUD01051149.1~~GFUD01051149.1.p1  ORF type:complete len:226 (+),score=59.67 GFUD01051149.1:55-732(+)